MAWVANDPQQPVCAWQARSAAAASPHCPLHIPLERNIAAPPNGDLHRVYMYFMLRSGWHCHFLEPDLKTALPKRLTFTHARKIVELAERGGYSMTDEGRHAGTRHREWTGRHLAPAES
jgi:hypothetical protein